MIGSSHRSNIGSTLVGGTASGCCSGASAPVAVAPTGYTAAGRGMQTLGCGFDGSQEAQRALAWAAALARAASARFRDSERLRKPTLPTSWRWAVGWRSGRSPMSSARAPGGACGGGSGARSGHRRRCGADGGGRPRAPGPQIGRAGLVGGGFSRVRAAARRAARQCLERTHAFDAVPRAATGDARD